MIAAHLAAFIDLLPDDLTAYETVPREPSYPYISYRVGPRVHMPDRLAAANTRVMFRVSTTIVGRTAESVRAIFDRVEAAVAPPGPARRPEVAGRICGPVRPAGSGQVLPDLDVVLPGTQSQHPYYAELLWEFTTTPAPEES